MSSSTSQYVGRFAPSPTGPLHAGSLLAALASYLDAKANHGLWLLRIEDVDTHRTVANAESAIKHTLDRHGLHWDREAPAQSTRTARYEEALELLHSAGHTYFCNCPRKRLRQQGAVYPGTCRGQRHVDYRPATDHEPASHAIRFDISHVTVHVDEAMTFNDGICGRQAFSDNELGDFIIRRRDSLFAYQLAVVCDDIDQQISHVVRGSDLLPSTPWQLMLYQALNAHPPSFAHLPLIVNAADGAKLSKQTGAKGVDDEAAFANIITSLGVLGQTLPEPGQAGTIAELLNIASQNWDMAQIPTGPALR